MRRAALVLAAALVVAAPAADAGAKRHHPRRTKHAAREAAKRTVRGPDWRVAPSPTPALPTPIVPTGEPPPLDAPVVPAGGPAVEEPAPAPPPPPPLCDPSPWLGVTAEDVGGFRFRLSRTCVPAGTVLFQFRNIDLATHNLWAEGIAPAAPQRRIAADTPGEKTITASAQLAAGRWRLFCSLEGHEAMSRLVDVTPAG